MSYENEITKEFVAAVRSAAKKCGDRVEIDMPVHALVVIIAQLQLALRHPSNKGASADDTKKVVEMMIDSLERLEPFLGPMLRRGFNPAHDVPVKGPTS